MSPAGSALDRVDIGPLEELARTMEGCRETVVVEIEGGLTVARSMERMGTIAEDLSERIARWRDEHRR